MQIKKLISKKKPNIYSLKIYPLSASVQFRGAYISKCEVDGKEYWAVDVFEDKTNKTIVVTIDGNLLAYLKT